MTAFSLRFWPSLIIAFIFPSSIQSPQWARSQALDLSENSHPHVSYPLKPFSNALNNLDLELRLGPDPTSNTQLDLCHGEPNTQIASHTTLDLPPRQSTTKLTSNAALDFPLQQPGSHSISNIQHLSNFNVAQWMSHSHFYYQNPSLNNMAYHLLRWQNKDALNTVDASYPFVYYQQPTSNGLNKSYYWRSPTASQLSSTNHQQGELSSKPASFGIEAQENPNSVNHNEPILPQRMLSSEQKGLPNLNNVHKASTAIFKKKGVRTEPISPAKKAKIDLAEQRRVEILTAARKLANIEIPKIGLYVQFSMSNTFLQDVQKILGAKALNSPSMVQVVSSSTQNALLLIRFLNKAAEPPAFKEEELVQLQREAFTEFQTFWKLALDFKLGDAEQKINGVDLSREILETRLRFWKKWPSNTVRYTVVFGWRLAQVWVKLHLAPMQHTLTSLDWQLTFRNMFSKFKDLNSRFKQTINDDLISEQRQR
ncbi:hypothetical protein O181_031085 [Austropuccinia psidii MF-1]|uniref:Uncharacterized protein n=1 Tax=Austropuccinia psidii MF-1 TaxID=1389203 RepID=A0A9Q3CXB6_9BASI|nr:hypothetical protein [Austropuccinia psidii MF-1]